MSNDINQDNIQKALTTLEIGYLSGEVDEQTIISARMSAEDLEKGRKANIGEIRDWKGGKFRRTAEGWEPVKEGGKLKATDQPNMSEKVQGKVFGEGEKKPNKELLGEHSITKNGEKGSIKVGWSEIGEHYTYSGNLGKSSISGNNVSEEKIKELLGSKEKEDKDGSWFNKLEQDYNEKKNQLNLLREDNWNPGFANNFSKNYGEDKFVKTMIVRPETDFKKGENFFTVDCGYSKLPTYGEEANKYHASLDELKSKRFSYAREAAKAADEFASKWNK